MHVEEALPIGTLVGGKYRVERLLGRGAMAHVVEATNVVLGQRVALKILKGSVRSPEALTRFHREAQIAAQLPGEHVARVVDTGVAETGAPFLVMELLVGRDLEQELAARGRIPMAEAVDIVLQGARGVAEAHAMGLVHRDIKPSNLFLAERRDGTRVVKVLDFGISKVTGDGASLTQTAVNIGTPLFMSPEQIISSSSVDARTDQHALAAVLFMLITGHAPYSGESLTELALAITARPAPSIRDEIPNAPTYLDAAIRRALSKKREDRFPSLAELAESIAQAGTAGSAPMALSIRAILSGRASASPAVALPAAGHVATVVMPPSGSPGATPRASAGPGVGSQGGFEAFVATSKPMGSSRGLLMGVAIGASLGLVGVALLVFGPRPRAPAQAASAQPASEPSGASPATTSTASAVASAVPAGSASSNVAPLADASAAPSDPAEPADPSEGLAPEASGAPGKPRAPGHAPKKPQSARDVFGSRR
jgi:tRNA A-37 threonylcarbamoyl transferase component Bud32